MSEYPIIFEPSFVIFWGGALAFAIFCGGLLMFSLVAAMILVLISHEHAHLKQCERSHVMVNSVRFSWFGGMIDADIAYARDAVDILAAGVKDTGFYAFVFSAVLVAITVFLDTYSTGINVAGNPYLSFLNSMVVFTVVMFVTNILPITYRSQKHGLISPDGWAALRFMELRDELWNDGKSMAVMAGG